MRACGLRFDGREPRSTLEGAGDQLTARDPLRVEQTLDDQTVKGHDEARGGLGVRRNGLGLICEERLDPACQGGQQRV